MALNKVEICGVDTTKLPLLKEEEKKALFEKIKKGDEAAKEELFNALDKSYIQGITFSGGNPIEKENVEELSKFDLKERISRIIDEHTTDYKDFN